VARNGNEQVAADGLTQERIDQIRRNPPLCMSLQEAAAYLGVCPRKLRYDCKRRLIPYVKLGGKIIFRKEGLDRALARLEVRSLGD
jgi:excisionase family DNA binding protein